MQRVFIMFIKNAPSAMLKGLYQYFSAITTTLVIFLVKKKEMAQLLTKLQMHFC